MSEVIVRNDQQTMVRSMSAYLPGGELYQAATIPGTNFNALMAGLSGELLRAENYLFLYNSEFIPDITDVFILEWEQTLGIPDDCFPGDGTNEERRTHILVKLASLGVQTAEDFEDLGTLLGFDGIRVSSGAGGLDDIVVNGDFAVTSPWLLGGNWEISGGSANKTAGTGKAFILEFPIWFTDVMDQALSLDIGDLYALEYTISNYVSGSITANLGGTDGSTNSTDGTFYDLVLAGSDHTFFRFKPDEDFEGSIDEAKVFPSIGTLTDSLYTIVVTLPGSFDLGNEFPMDFPVIFGATGISILACLFNQLKPANCTIVYRNPS